MLLVSGMGVRIIYCNVKLLVIEEDIDDELEMFIGKWIKRGDNCRKLMLKNFVIFFVCFGSFFVELINIKRKI